MRYGFAEVLRCVWRGCRYTSSQAAVHAQGVSFLVFAKVEALVRIKWAWLLAGFLKSDVDGMAAQAL
jgi:hypothetical protein